MTYSIYKILPGGNRMETGYKNCDYRLTLYGLREILKHYKLKAEHGDKQENRRINRFLICVNNGGDRYKYEIQKD
jgi:hypothetical protein